MKETDEEYDVVIIGSGLGGLSCANILGRHGFKVVVLEKNHQIGGNLQVFSREKTIFDTGVHYMGGLDEGQNLHTLFKYFGILDDLKLIRMDPDGFDRMRFYNEDKIYKYGMGYDRFIEVLSEDFPDDVEAIKNYCDLIQKFCAKFPLYQLRSSSVDYRGDDMLGANAKETIYSLTENQRLRDVFSGTNALYAGNEKTPFYVHALVVNSYIESSWRCVDGGSQIAIAMQKRIRELGGQVWKRAEVVSVNSSDGKSVDSVNLSDGRVVKGKKFISNMDPKSTIRVFGEEKFRKAYVNRINDLQNTISSFTVHLVFKEKAFKYLNYNIYQCNADDVWNLTNYKKENWPEGYMLSTPANSKDKEYADGASIMVYMRTSEFDPWKDSFNTIVDKNERPDGYEEFKTECAEKIIDLFEQNFPDIREKIVSYYCSTPLTFRDYIGSEDGNLYGIEKDSSDGLKTFINPKTRIPNLYLTGENINLHGILGVSISSLVTCFEFVDKDELIKSVNAAK